MFKYTRSSKRKQVIMGCLGVIVLILWFGYIISNRNKFVTNKKPAKPKTEQEIRKERIESQFSAWDGSHSGLTKIIKKSMNDPKSYKHEETIFWDKGDHLIVKTTFRGKNAFGGVVKNWVKAKVDFNGNVLNVIEQGP